METVELSINFENTRIKPHVNGGEEIEVSVFFLDYSGIYFFRCDKNGEIVVFDIVRYDVSHTSFYEALCFDDVHTHGFEFPEFHVKIMEVLVDKTQFGKRIQAKYSSRRDFSCFPEVMIRNYE